MILYQTTPALNAHFVPTIYYSYFKRDSNNHFNPLNMSFPVIHPHEVLYMNITARQEDLIQQGIYNRIRLDSITFDVR